LRCFLRWSRTRPPLNSLQYTPLFGRLNCRILRLFPSGSSYTFSPFQLRHFYNPPIGINRSESLSFFRLPPPLFLHARPPLPAMKRTGTPPLSSFLSNTSLALDRNSLSAPPSPSQSSPWDSLPSISSQFSSSYFTRFIPLFGSPPFLWLRFHLPFTLRYFSAVCESRRVRFLFLRFFVPHCLDSLQSSKLHLLLVSTKIGSPIVLFPFAGFDFFTEGRSPGRFLAA